MPCSGVPKSSGVHRSGVARTPSPAERSGWDIIRDTGAGTSVLRAGVAGWGGMGGEGAGAQGAAGGGQSLRPHRQQVTRMHFDARALYTDDKRVLDHTVCSSCLVLRRRRQAANESRTSG